jgi:hypothetical protein
MRLSRRSFLGGALGSIGLLFGGFGWKEPEDWERDEGLTVERLAEIRDSMSMTTGYYPQNGKYLMYVNHRVAEQIRMDFL